MGDRRRFRCRGCGRTRDDGITLSWTGLCPACAEVRVTENVIGLATHSGRPFARWRQGMAASVGAVLVDGSATRMHTSDADG